MKNPADLVIDIDAICLACEEGGVSPYVDVRVDTIPACEGDPDYSEDPDVLRKIAAWLVRAADWLEKKQGR